nr:hypothetical protein [Tanacetum cinerariifolium]
NKERTKGFTGIRVQNLYYTVSSTTTANLLTTQAFDDPTSHVHNTHRQNELEKIHNVLKLVCDTHRLPLAQTWATSPLTTFASHDQILKKSCSSFHTRCFGKVCMSTAALPYYVQDLRLWSFRKACKEQHLDKLRGLVGRALLSHGSCFCEDVTKLGQEEYPLVHYALMSGLSSCFAIFLHSIESNNDYTANLLTTQAFDDPTSHVHNTHRQNELEKIHNVLKLVCDTHRLPLAQTWATSPLTTFASHDQ